MIARMHVRHDWQKWLLTDQRTVSTLCGKTTANKLAGIPTISGQPAIITNSATGQKWPGWCEICMRSLYRKLVEFWREKPDTSSKIASAYHDLDLFTSRFITRHPLS